MRFSTQRASHVVLAITSFVYLFPWSQAVAQAPQTSLTLTSSQQDQLFDLTKRVLDHADRAGCKKNSCTILVVNFAGPSGSTSIFGMQIADAVSARLAANSKAIKVVDRQRLQTFLEKERIPSKLLEEDNAARWQAMEQSANAVLVGFLQDSPAGVHLRVQLLDSHELAYKKPMKEGPIEDVTFDHLDADLTPAEPFGKALRPDPAARTTNTSSLRTGKSALPHALRAPNPEYTNAARIAKFNGNVMLELTISAEGAPVDVRVIRGAPFGLNQSSLKTVRTWSFQPAMSDGSPVQDLVAVEVTFRVN